MTSMTPPSGGAGGALRDVVDLIRHRGLVVDMFARVPLVETGVVAAGARASVDTYLRFAEACGSLDPAGAD